MIARVWRGVTLASNADSYLAYLRENVIPLYQVSSGNRGVLVLRDYRDNLANFLLLSLWESQEMLIQFTGSQLEVKMDSEEKSFLVAFESLAINYEVV